MNNELIERIEIELRYEIWDEDTIKTFADCKAKIELLEAENISLRNQNTALDAKLAELDRVLLANETLKALNIEYLEHVKALEAKPVGEQITDEQLFALREAHEEKYGQYVDNEDFIMVCREVLKLKQSPPSIDALIAEIKALPLEYWKSSVCGSIEQDSVYAILDKYRGVK